MSWQHVDGVWDQMKPLEIQIDERSCEGVSIESSTRPPPTTHIFCLGRRISHRSGLYNMCFSQLSLFNIPHLLLHHPFEASL